MPQTQTLHDEDALCGVASSSSYASTSNKTLEDKSVDGMEIKERNPPFSDAGLCTLIYANRKTKICFYPERKHQHYSLALKDNEKGRRGEREQTYHFQRLYADKKMQR